MFEPKKLEDYTNDEKIKAFDILYHSCLEYFNYIKSDEFHEDNDYDHYIYEDVLTAVFGQEFWDYLNNKM